MSRSRRPRFRRAREAQGLDAIHAGIEEVSDYDNQSDDWCDCEMCLVIVDEFTVPGVEFARAA